jgi:hypothetical protein
MPGSRTRPAVISGIGAGGPSGWRGTGCGGQVLVAVRDGERANDNAIRAVSAPVTA